MSTTYPAAAVSWIHVLQHWAVTRPDALAFRFLSDGEAREVTVTFADLDRKARAIASSLQEQGAQGDRALLLYPSGLDFIAAFMGCLYARVVAVPAYPPDPTRLQRTLPRLEATIADSGARFVLTTSSVHLLAGPVLESRATFEAMRWIPTDALAEDAEAWRMPSVDAETLAFLQYTSGSTGSPKGVMVSHGNLLHNSRAIQAGFGHTDELVGVGWLPLYHDMGLIGKVLQPLYLGRPCTLLSPLDFLRRPARWLEAISRYGATTSGGPNFAYDLCARKVSSTERAALDLSRWRVAFVGAEPVRLETLERFASTFQSSGFRREAFFPCYGLAESTLMVTGGWLGTGANALALESDALQRGRVELAAEAASGAQQSLSNGPPVSDQRVLIVDPERRVRAPAGHVGEIWLSGPSVAGGYWNRPTETAETFSAHLADTGEGPFLRTGDLGFLHEGQLHVTGRIKDVIIIRGRNHHPHDIEHTVERGLPAVRPSGVAAFAVELNGEEQLVVVAELRAQGEERAAEDLQRIVATMCQAIAEEHEVQPHVVWLLRPGAIPKTSSGKIQRHLAKASYLTNDFKATLRWSRADEKRPAESSNEGVLEVYAGWNETLEKLETRSIRYRFDLEKDICWDQLDAPGDHLGPTWLASYGVDHVALRSHPAAHDLFQWAMALSICETFIAVEEGILRFLTSGQNRHFASKSLEAFREEEVKHVELFRRYALHLRQQRPELSARFDDVATNMVQFHRRVMDNSLRMKESAYHYQAWLYALFLEEGSIYLHEQLVLDGGGLQPAWVAVHAAHRREEIQHVATDAAYVEALDLSEDERDSLSRLWLRVAMIYFGRLSGLEPAYLLLAEHYPEQAKAIEHPLRMPEAYLEDLLHARAFAKTRAAARYISRLSQGGAGALQDALAVIAEEPSVAGVSKWEGAEGETVLTGSALYIDLAEGAEGVPFVEVLRRAPVEARRAALIRRIGAHVAETTGRAPGDIGEHAAGTHLLKLGIDSLAAVDLATRLEADLGIDVPVSAAYDNTLGELSDQLLDHLKPRLADVGLVKLLDPANRADDLKPASFTRAVAMRGRSSLAPVFCVAGLAGTVSYMMPLSAALGDSRPFVALQAPGIDGAEAPMRSVEEMARRYLNEVQGFQPTGPYVLAGHSFGGLVAYEMAQRLTEQGEVVSNLFLLDSSWCNGAAPSDELQDIMAMFELVCITRRKEDPPLPYSAIAALDTEARRRTLAQHLGAEKGIVPGSTLANVIEVYGANYGALERYRPAPYAGPVTLLRSEGGIRHEMWHPARRTRMQFDDPSLGWGMLCASLRVVDVPGDHLSIFYPAYVRSLAAAITRDLAGSWIERGAGPASDQSPDRMGFGGAS